MEPIRQSEPYYYDALRRHLDIVCKVLHAADRWPPSVPFLIDSCQPLRYGSVAAIAERLGDEHARLIRRATDHGHYVNSPQGVKDLGGGANRLEVALALASRQMVTPRVTPDGQAVAVRLVEALRDRAVVMWRTHADTMPDEAAALSVLALADIHDATAHAGVPWTLVLDEFGAVIKTAAERALASLQRGRSHDGQLVVITQSAADVEALTGQTGLLASLTDNFAAIVAHRQTSPESRDWLAKLMGTRALWQHTNQTTGHGNQHSGQGSARRVREFRIGSDVFGTPAPRRSGHLHARRRRTHPRRDRPDRSRPGPTLTHRPRRRAARLRDRDPSRRRPPGHQDHGEPIQARSTVDAADQTDRRHDTTRRRVAARKP